MKNGLFKNKYRIDSSRLKGHDYSGDGLYFITICTHDRELFFGDVVDNKMILNDLGQMAEKYWLEIPQHFENIELDEFIIMPNHVHGIIVIDNTADGGKHRVRCDARGFTDARVRRDAINRVSTDAAQHTDTNDNHTGGITGKYNPMGKKSLGEIVRWFKGRYKFESKTINPAFAWQTRFYDHVVRNENSLDNIRQYIINNPAQWENDRNDQENIWM